MRALLRRPHVRRRGYAVRREPASTVAPAADAAPAPGVSEVDFAAHRVRAAGGPTDLACYQCACGCVFDAAVSTSVHCPHCGSEQAW